MDRRENSPSLDVALSEKALSIQIIEDTINGHREDIQNISLRLTAMKHKLGWITKIPGSGYAKLFRQLKTQTTQLEALLLFLEDVKKS